MRFTSQIEAHDFETKVRHIREFLEDGDKVKVTTLQMLLVPAAQSGHSGGPGGHKPTKGNDHGAKGQEES